MALSSLRHTGRITTRPGACVASVQAGMSSRRHFAATAAKPVLMTHSEAFVETMAAHKVDTVFGIVGSAFMDALDLFPSAGIRFVSVQHEQNSAHMADGYARMKGSHGVVIGQNGPGVTNSVTALLAAKMGHSPVVIVTPEASTMTMGLGGFQEAEQMKLFEAAVKNQVHVHHPKRMAELTARAFDLAVNENGPVQLNIPRDYFYGECEHVIREPNLVEHGSGGPQAVSAAFAALCKAKKPVLLVGGGTTSEAGHAAVREFAELLSLPVATTYLHNDAFPASHPNSLGPIGYLGSLASMKMLRDADLVLAVGTRLNPFGTLPQYGMSYWPEQATLVQVDCDAKRLGLTKQTDVSVCADAALFLRELSSRVQANKSAVSCLSDKASRQTAVEKAKADWDIDLTARTNAEAPYADKRDESRMRPRRVLRELEKALPTNAVVSTDIGNICSVANGYLRFEHPRHFLAPLTFGNCGYSSPAAIGAKAARPDLPCVAYTGDGAWGMQLMEILTCVREKLPITVCVFNNGQWGAEKKNQVLWFGDRYVGTNLENPSFAAIAKAMGAEGVVVDNIDKVGSALKEAIDAQMKEGKTTIVEIMVTRELDDPFRRDAMNLPQRHLAKYKSTQMEHESATGQPTD